MQETRTLKAHDGKTIYVEVNRRAGNRSAVLIIHGYGGNIREHIHHNAAQIFPAKGFDVWRIALYAGEKNSRTMLTATGDDHLKDIERVLAAMAKKYKKLFVIGHSYGGALAIRAADERVCGAVLWDPSRNSKPKCNGDDWMEDSDPDLFRLDWGKILLVSKRFDQDFVRLTRYDDVLESYKTPTLVIKSSEGKRDYTALQKNKAFRFEKVPNSDHCFNREGNEKALFAYTLKFLKKII